MREISFGTPSVSSKSGNISLALINILEAKIFAKNDTTGKPKKVKLIDNFAITTSYNIFADSPALGSYLDAIKDYPATEPEHFC